MWYSWKCTFREMSVSNSVLVLRFLTAQELIASFSMNTYRVSGPNLARRCIVEGRCRLWHKCKTDKLCPVCYFGPYWKITFCSEWFMHRRSQIEVLSHVCGYHVYKDRWAVAVGELWHALKSPPTQVSGTLLPWSKEGMTISHLPNTKISMEKILRTWIIFV